jgi:rhodanese-related sulfurtransferase/TusA-related sulfurtransferase
MAIHADKVIDCLGLSCPMPIVRTKKAIEELEPGQVLEIRATDRGSLADLKGWAKSTGHDYLGTLEQDNILIHYVRKADPKEVKPEMKYPHTVQNEEVEALIGKDGITIIDVREPAEFAFGHVPGAISIPLGDLEQRLNELNPDHEIYVICRTGNRSDMACKLLSEKGFSQVKNVLPGMTQWTGPIERKE